MSDRSVPKMLALGVLSAVSAMTSLAATAQAFDPMFCGVDSGGVPTSQVYHYDKIIFTVTGSLARKCGLPADSELDIKVLDDPTEIADLKRKVIDSLDGLLDPACDPPVTDDDVGDITIVDVDYAMICAEVEDIER